jgi:hypothetical protein
MRSVPFQSLRALTLRLPAMFWWVVTIAGIGLFLRFTAAMTDAHALILKSIPDDGYYYFQIARNFASGAGISSDGIAPTNGFHPLWLFVITPLWLVFDSYRAINAALIVASLFDLLAALLLYRVANRLTARPEVATLAMALYFLNPFTLTLALNGLETAINMAMIALVAERFLALADHPRLTLRHLTLLGLAFGLAILARTDNVFLLVGVATMLLLRRDLPWRTRVSSIVCIGSLAGLITAPWFIWNYLTFGSFMQVSGVALPYLERQIFLRENPAAQTLSGTWDYFLHQILQFNLLHRIGIFSGLGYWPNWDAEAVPSAFMFGLLLAGPFAIAETRRMLLKQFWQLGFLFIFVALLLGYHIGVRWIVREWYVLPVTWLIMLLLALGYNALLRLLAERVPWRQLHRVVLVIACLTLTLHSQKFWSLGMYPWQGGFHMLQNAADRMPIGSRVGVSDSGFVSYFSNKQIVNIDGIVNNAAAEAITNASLMDYLIQSCISYIYAQERYRRDYFFGPGFADRLENYDNVYLKIKRTPAEEAACYTLPADGVLNLNNWSGQTYLKEGWSTYEAGSEGIWAAADEATLHFSIDQIRPYTVSFRALPFSYKGAPAQSVTVLVNDKPVTTVELAAEPQFADYSVNVAKEFLQPALNTLTLRFAYAVTPSQVGYGRDNRTLAARFASFTFVPQQ